MYVLKTCDASPLSCMLQYRRKPQLFQCLKEDANLSLNNSLKINQAQTITHEVGRA